MITKVELGSENRVLKKARHEKHGVPQSVYDKLTGFGAGWVICNGPEAQAAGKGGGCR
jgi:hypothetical protein